ncbi:MAG: outer membrane lipoprotein-sorting protein, partial [Cytophagales bacterium]
MKLKSVLTMLAVVCFVAAKAQTADEIIAKYHENTGGVEKWKALQGIKMTATMKIQAMELPMEMTRLKDGRSHSVASV